MSKSLIGFSSDHRGSRGPLFATDWAKAQWRAWEAKRGSNIIAYLREMRNKSEPPHVGCYFSNTHQDVSIPKKKHFSTG
jgi:hypothetical protein